MDEVERAAMMRRLATVHNMTLDCLYKLHCEKVDNASIRRELERKHLPPMSDEQIAMMRQEFQEKELRFPEKMRQFRERLNVK